MWIKKLTVKKIESLYNKISVDIIIVSVKGVNNNVGMVINDVSLLNLMTTLWNNKKYNTWLLKILLIHFKSVI